MHHLAALSGCTPQLVPKAPRAANLSSEKSNGPRSAPSSNGAYASCVNCGMDELLPAEELRPTSVQWMSAVPFPVLYSVHASGPNRRPAARRSSASALPPYGLRFPASPDPPQCRAWHLGAGPSRWLRHV